MRDGDEYVLERRQALHHERRASPSLYVVFAKTDPAAGHGGISAFVVEADAPGFEVGRIEPKMGIKGSTTGELFFDDCRVPAANLLGEEGEGFRIAMRILDRSRPGIGAQGLGLAQGATDYALEYARTRETMGEPIAAAPADRGDARRHGDEVRGGARAALPVGQLIDEGDDGPELTKLSAMAKLYCTDVAMEVTTDAVQVLGGYGYIQEYPVERMMRDAKITQIYEGTNQIQRLVIAREMLQGGPRLPASPASAELRRDRAGTASTASAAEYERARPDVSARAGPRRRCRARGTARARCSILGAGTGKLTSRCSRERFARVVAVEPLDGMRVDPRARSCRLPRARAGAPSRSRSPDALASTGCSSPQAVPLVRERRTRVCVEIARVLPGRRRASRCSGTSLVEARRLSLPRGRPRATSDERLHPRQRRRRRASAWQATSERMRAARSAERPED